MKSLSESLLDDNIIDEFDDIISKLLKSKTLDEFNSITDLIIKVCGTNDQKSDYMMGVRSYGMESVSSKSIKLIDLYFGKINKNYQSKLYWNIIHPDYVRFPSSPINHKKYKQIYYIPEWLVEQLKKHRIL